MNAAEKLARHRLSVLELAQALGNVSEACRRRRVSRTQFYEYKRRFQTHGLVGLKDLPPIHMSHPMTTPPETADRILAVSMGHPSRGCNFLEAQLQPEGITESPVTIQSILNTNGLGTRYDRWLRLEQQHATEAIELTAEQVRSLEKQTPQFKERHVESSRPGELLSQDTFYVGRLMGVGKVYLHAVVDTYSSYAFVAEPSFGFLHTSKKPEAVVAVLHNDALPFYAEHDLPVGAVLTDNGREFAGPTRTRTSSTSRCATSSTGRRRCVGRRRTGL